MEKMFGSIYFMGMEILYKFSSTGQRMDSNSLTIKN